MDDPRQNNGVPAVFATAEEAVARVANDLHRQHGEGLTREQWLKLVSVFRAGVLPGRRAGRRPKSQVTAAYLYWKAGMRGVALFRKHIPGWEKHNRYHRMGEQKELMDAIRGRHRRFGQNLRESSGFYRCRSGGRVRGLRETRAGAVPIESD
jgi:hypothetical protein